MTARSQLTSHVLDAATGRPAVGVAIALQARDRQELAGWTTIDAAATDADGRVQRLGPDELAPGDYRLVFDTDGYFRASGTPAFYPEVIVTVTIAAPDQHYHVPLLLSPFAYSTYRGS